MIMFCYRSNVNDTTKVSPAEILQGRKLKLPIDILRPTNLAFDKDNSSDKTLDDLFSKMRITRENVRLSSDKALLVRKKNYDNCKTRKIKASFEIGNLVYWKKPICKKGFSPKLMPIWQGPFIVKNKLSDVNYVIGDEINSCVTVHCNNLKHCLDKTIKPVLLKLRGRPKKVT